MSGLKLVLALGLFALVWLGAPSSAQADDYASAAASSPASVELFGTSFCIVDSRLSTGCDSLSMPEVRFMVVRPEHHIQRWKIFGLTLCAAPDPLGPACDVVWVQPLAWLDDWRNQPEIRLQELLPR